MKVLVTVKAILDTDDIVDKGIKFAIEKSAFNRTRDNLAGYWAVNEINRISVEKEVTLNLL